MDKKENLPFGLEVITFSKYIKKDIKPSISTEWTLNGVNNEFFQYVKDCYEGSSTNSAIINAFSNYIYGMGLTCKDENINLLKYLSKRDTKLLVLDFYTYGAFALQVIWNSSEDIENKKPLKLKYIPIYKLGVSLDKQTNEVNGYWYSFDWEDKSRYKPKFFNLFDGDYKYDSDKEIGQDVEIAVVQRVSSDPFFANPSYMAGLQWAEIEMELSNSSISHIKNGFQVGKVINVPFVPATEELKQEYIRKMNNKFEGSSNTNSNIYAFNKNPDNKVTVESMEVTELNQQYSYYGEEAEKKLIIAHSAPPILFSGSRDGGGLGNNSEEMETALSMLYRKQINPIREDILDGLEDILGWFSNGMELEFKDFIKFDKEDEDDVPVEEVKEENKL